MNNYGEGLDEKIMEHRRQWGGNQPVITYYHDIVRWDDVWEAYEAASGYIRTILSDQQAEYYSYRMQEKIREYHKNINLKAMAEIVLHDMKTDVHEHDNVFTICESTKNEVILICDCGAWRLKEENETANDIDWFLYPNGLAHLIDQVNPQISIEDKKAILDTNYKLSPRDYTALVGMVAMHLNVPSWFAGKNEC